MRFVLDILPVAIADIVEAARWYEAQREPEHLFGPLLQQTFSPGA